MQGLKLYLWPKRPTFLRHHIYIYIWEVVKIISPFLGTLNNRCRIILRTQKRTIILTTTHIYIYIHTHIEAIVRNPKMVVLFGYA